jgi:hypothetical protein
MYQAALEVLARAEPWPSTTKPGRIDYVRAEAYAGMGDRRRAETYYLRAYRADPTYFWTVADLALFYASSGGPVAERRRLVAPYLNRLRSEFVGHPALPEILARVERKLAAMRLGFRTPWNIGTCQRQSPYEIRPIHTSTGCSRTHVAGPGGDTRSATSTIPTAKQASNSRPWYRDSNSGDGALKVRTSKHATAGTVA